jgi:hypothetical protein
LEIDIDWQLQIEQKMALGLHEKAKSDMIILGTPEFKKNCVQIGA